MAAVTGGIGNDVLTGSALADVIDGGQGADVMMGGVGNDIYYVDNVGDQVAELATKGSGADLVYTSVSYSLDTAPIIIGGVSMGSAQNVENITLVNSIGTGAGGAGAGLTVAGNALNNVITDNTTGGINTLIGGLGNDTYVVKVGDTVVENTNEGIDTIQASFSYSLAGLNNVENLTLTGSATGVTGTGNALDNVLDGSQNSAANVLIGNGGNDTYILGANDTVIAGAGIDTIETGFSYTLGNNEDNLVLLGTAAISGTGNALNNAITGNAANNMIDGGAGADTMTGGNGNDTYTVDNVGDVIVEAAGKGTGVDTVFTSISYTLSANVENLVLTGGTIGIGNADANTITDNTAAGGVTLDGGAGNDTYVVKAGDTILDSSGVDTVVASINFDLSLSAATVENLTLSGVGNINGTGNALDNVIVGNVGANILDGGLGNDTYYVGANDKILEAANAGTDTIVSSIDWNLAVTSLNVENLILTGAAIRATGDLGNNVITGNNNNNIIDGGAGADTMAGGGGNDTYTVDNVGDVIVETAAKGSGIDTVNASVTYTLSANVENLNLTGVGNIDGVGNTSNNIIVGNAGNNVLTGGAGADILTGGVGSDSFVMSSIVGLDKITDFVSGTDSIQISMAGIKIGDGNVTMTSAVQATPASGAVGSGFSSTSELVIFTYNAANSTTNPLGSTAAALEIGSANAAFAVGDTRLFVVDDGTSSAVYLFTSTLADSVVSASELTLLATLSGTAATTAADYSFVA